MRRNRAAAVRTAVLTSAALTLGALVAGPVPHASAAPEAAPSGRVFHVDCRQKVNGDGLHSPFNSLRAASAQGPYQPGDRILVRRGTTCTGRMAPTGSGSAARPIILGAYGSGARPVLAGGGTPSKTATLTLTDVEYWTVQDLHVTNSSKAKSTKAYRSAVLLRNNGARRLAGMRVQRLLVDRVTSNLVSRGTDSREYGGIVVQTWGHRHGGYDRLDIGHNTVNGVGRTGIIVANHAYASSRDRNVRIHDNVVRSAKGDSIVLRGANDSRIDHNVSANGSNMKSCAHCGKVTPDMANAGIWPANVKNVRIDHNEVYGEHAYGGDGEGFDIDRNAEGVVLEYNYAHDNEGGGVLLCGSKNTTVRFNIFENNKKSAFTFIGSIPAKNTSIYNNTVYVSPRTKAGVMGYFNGAHGSKISFKNNVVYNYGFATWRWPAKHTTRANTLVGLHAKGRPSDSLTSYADPRLKKPGSGRTGMSTLKGYRPAHPSTFKKGVPIPKSVTRDFFGKKINPERPPRGAAG